MEAMTQEQRQKTKEALSRYGQKNWVYGPCNWGWKRAIQLAEEYYREADPGLRGSILQLRYTPELVFELDESITRGAHISEMLHELKNEGKLGGEDEE